MPDGEDPPLQDHMHTHLQHLPPIPYPREPPAWVPDDRIYNNTGQAYHYPQPTRTMAPIRRSHADNTLMNHLEHKLQTALYFSALDLSLLPVHLQEQLPLLDRVARCYDRRGIDIPPEYTICPPPPPTAGDMGTLQTMLVGSRRQPPGHVDTGGHQNTTHRMGPDHATNK